MFATWSILIMACIQKLSATVVRISTKAGLCCSRQEHGISRHESRYRQQSYIRLRLPMHGRPPPAQHSKWQRHMSFLGFEETTNVHPPRRPAPNCLEAICQIVQCWLIQGILHDFKMMEAPIQTPLFLPYLLFCLEYLVWLRGTSLEGQTRLDMLETNTRNMFRKRQ